MKRKYFLYVVMLIVVAVVAAGCETQAPKKVEKKEEAKFETIEEGVLTVGSDIAFPPFEFKDEKTQEIVGFDIDLMKEIGKKLGLKVKFVNATFDTIIPALNAKKFDCIMSAMTITEERKKQVDFSDPYIDSNQSLAVREDSAITGVADLKDKIIGVQRGTTGELKAQELKEKYGFKEIKAYDDTLLAFEDLRAGRVDGVINDLPVSADLIKKDPAFKLVEEIPTGEQYGIALRKDSKELLEGINKALADIKDEGTYDTIYKKWFETK